MRKPQIFLNLVIAVILLFTASAALAQPQEPYPLGEITVARGHPFAGPTRPPGQKEPLGEITLTAEQVAGGIGYTWDQGILKFKGKTYKFEVKGLNVATVGISKISTRGDVFNLKAPSDLAGKYVAAAASAALINLVKAGLTMRNEKSVLIDLKSDQTGVKLSLGADGLSISMK